MLTTQRLIADQSAEDKWSLECLSLNGMFLSPWTFREQGGRGGGKNKRRARGQERVLWNIVFWIKHGIAPINPRERWLSACYLHKDGPISISLWIGERLITSYSPWGTVGNKSSVTFIQIRNPSPMFMQATVIKWKETQKSGREDLLENRRAWWNWERDKGGSQGI